MLRGRKHTRRISSTPGRSVTAKPTLPAPSGENCAVQRLNLASAFNSLRIY